MKRIFRSIIDIPKGKNSTIDQKDLILNYRAFIASKIKPDDQAYIKLFHWMEAHFREYKMVPSIILMNDRARASGEEAILAILKDIVQETPFTGSNYKEILKGKFEEQSKEGFQEVLTSTWKAANDGLTIGKGRKKQEIKGINQAVEFFISKVRKFRMGDLNAKIESNIRSKEDSIEVKEDYNERKNSPLANTGMYSLLENIDNVQRGLKPGELMIVAAYVGQGKTTMGVNLGYNGMIQGLNGLFVAMEMTFNEMRTMNYVLHTANPDWYDHPKYKNLAGKIEYNKVRYGELSEVEEEFYKVAAEDLAKRKDFGELFVYQPPEALTPSKLEMLVYDYNARLADKGKTLDYVIVDYVGLMVPDKTERYGDWNIDLNNIIKKMKNLAINFDNGRGLRVITPFQVNRTGHKEAEKNDGIYKLSALSNANEAERSADIVISLFMSDEMRKANIIKVGCLKHRGGDLFSPFEANINLKSKLMRDIIQSGNNNSKGEDLGISDIPLDS